jgi:hypothetical protein
VDRAVCEKRSASNLSKPYIQTVIARRVPRAALKAVISLDSGKGPRAWFSPR